MERLQSAIAKARAARDSLSGPAPARPVVGPDTSTPVAAPAMPADVEQEWEALKRIEVSDQHLIDQRVVSLGRGAEATEFDKLRTRVMQRMQAKSWTRLAITSPGPGCGKSTIAMNLAFGLARQEGARVLLLELDMRRPSFRRILGVHGDNDISRVFAGTGRIEDHLLRARDNLAVGITGRVSESAELLHSPNTAAVLDDIQARLQPSVILFDMPPFKVSDDTISFLDKTDSVMVVAAAGQTTLEELDDTEREIAAQSEVLGVVLNKCRHTGQDSQYYYYG